MSEIYAITGATGLLGANLSNSLTESGAEVYALIKDENSKNILSPKINRIYGDITNKNDVEYFIQKSQPKYFIHLAAQTQAYDSLKYPYQTFNNNILGSLNVLECLKEYGLTKKIIIASSDKAYGELIKNEYKENHRLNGIYPYDASKSATDLISQSYAKTYNLPITITRACNIYGIGDFNKQRLIPGIIYAYKNKNTFKIRNNGTDYREYIDVRDVVEAYKKIINLDITQHLAFNISSHNRFTTMEVFNLVQKVVGKKIIVEIDSHQSLEIKKQFMNSDLIYEITGWRSKYKLEEDIYEITKWYLENI